MGPEKIGEGKFTLFLKECPQCRAKNRKFDDTKISGSIAMSAGALITGSIFGAPLMGAFGAIGIIQLLIAGSITGAVAVRLIKYNYEALIKLKGKKIYTCQECGCTDLIKLNSSKTQVSKGLAKNQNNLSISKQNDDEVGPKNDDLTNQIIAHLIDVFKKEEGYDVSKNIEAMKRIEKAAKKAKEALLKNEQAHVHLPYLVLSSKGPKHLDISIKKSQVSTDK